MFSGSLTPTDSLSGIYGEQLETFTVILALQPEYYVFSRCSTRRDVHQWVGKSQELGSAPNKRQKVSLSQVLLTCYLCLFYQ